MDPPQQLAPVQPRAGLDPAQKRMTAVTFAFFIHEADEHLRARLDAWAETMGLHYLVYESGHNYVLVICKATPHLQVPLSRGAWTVKDKLGLGYVPTRITPGSPFMEKLLRITNGNRAPDPVFHKGEQFSFQAMAGALSKAGRLINLQNSMTDLVTAGDLKVTDVGRLDIARAVLERERVCNAFSQKDDLEGELPIEFGLYDADGNLLPPGPTKQLGARTRVNILGLPGDTMSKRKHWWIYSKDGNRGKTTTTKLALADRYKAHFISDVRNAVEIPPDAHFLILDEVDPRNKPTIATLKALTSGTASLGSINRKSYGASYRPRDDAQFIVLSNHSPYEVYAVWDKEKRLRRCRGDHMGPLELRFHIIRLDGDDLEEKVKWYDPQHLSQEDYRRHIRDVFYSELRLSNYTGNCSTALVKKVLVQLFQIHSMRTPGTPTYLTLANDLQDALPMDDYLTVLDIFERFGTVNGFPQAESCLEYNVHFRHDPHADAYAEMLAHMRHDPVLAPRFDRRAELTASGPVGNPGRRRAMDRAAEVLKNQPRPRVDPRNQHHLAMPHGGNPNRDRVPTPPPPTMMEPEPHYCEEEACYDEWEPSEDQWEVAWKHE